MLRTSESIGQLAAALAAAQGKFSNPDRNRTVKVTMKSGGSYTFAYATLDEILSMARQPLADNKLSVIQAVYTDSAEGGVIVTVVTRLLHESGEWIETVISSRSGGEIQAVGSTITYLRRYSYVSLLCIASEEDDDGNAAAGNVVVPAKPARPKLTEAEESYIASARQSITDATTLDELAAIGEALKDKSVAVRESCREMYATKKRLLETQ